MHAQNTWIRVAGNSERIRRGEPLGWRCFADPDLTEYPITHCVFSGKLTPRNCIMETNKDHDERGLLAWFRFFGSVRIESQIAYIELADPD